MSSMPIQLGRRERNKQQKLERIMAAACELFAQHGVDDVTTQQIADKADIGAGTLFLYVKSKGELLLMVQNSTYAQALLRGQKNADGLPHTIDAVMAIVRAVVECNRTQIDNGRTYLREMVFGDHEEPHHREALGLNAQTESAIAALLQRDGKLGARDAALLARTVSAVMFVAMAASVYAESPVEVLIAGIKEQLRAILPH
ncbi:TetR/AcrR family transcriptional regulator [Arthrobacter sp. Sr24]